MKREVIIAKVLSKLRKEIDPNLLKKMKIDDVDVSIKHSGLPGGRDFLPEAPEYEIESASLIIPDFTQEEAEKLPMEFEVTKPYHYEDGKLELDLEITFKVKVESKKILPSGKVEIIYKDTLVGE